MSFIRSVTAWVAWPGLLAACIAATAAGFAWGMPLVAFYVSYAGLTLALLLLQRWMPHEAAWLGGDGQLLADLGHTLVSTGAVQGMLLFTSMVGASAGLAQLAGAHAGLWPHDWPLAMQVVLGMAVLELALYWAHRLAHEWPRLWLFHAIHHSVGRLCAVNNGRFHFVDAVKSVLPGIALLTLCGAPVDVMIWLSALGGYIGMLTHSNVEMRFGILSVVFNTPELHRWHHSRDLREGNKNYGESLMLWDWAFGTWFNANRRPPVDIGVPDAIPTQFLGQLLWPFQALRPGEPHPVHSLDGAARRGAE